MAHQVLRYQPSEAGEYADGWPRSHVTDVDVAARAAAEGRSVEDVMREALAFRRADGKPLYTETAKAKDEVGDLTPAAEPERPAKPRVPLGTKPGE